MRSKFVSALLLLALIIRTLTPVTTARADSPSQVDNANSKGVSLAGMLNPDGTLRVDGAFNGSLDLEGYSVAMDSQRGPIFSSEKEIAAAGIAHNIFAIAINGSNVYVGGDFQDADGIPEADFIAKWNGSAWSALGHNGAGNGSLNLGVRAIAISGLNVYVGGNFTNVSNYGTTMNDADYLALWDGNNWFQLGHNGAGNGSLNNGVAALAIDGANLYVGGHFTNANNKGTVLGAADYIAKWNGSNWSSLGSNGVGNGSLNAVASAITINGSNIYVGGSFTNVNNNGTVLGAADIIARWNGSNWFALGDNGAGNGSLNAGNGSSGWIAAITMVGTDVYVGGSFMDVNNKGTVIPSADFIARWDGSDWHSLGSDGSSNGAIPGQVYSIVVSGLAVYVGGGFHDVNNNGTVITEADYIARWNGIGWSAVGTNGDGNGPIQGLVLAMAVSGSNLYAVGSFTTVVINNTPLLNSGHIAKWDNTNWSALATASTPPQVLSVNRAGANPTNAANVNFTVTFSKPVTGVNLTAPFNDFSLTTTGVLGAAISAVSGSGSVYTVTVNTGVGNGMISLNVVDNNSIVDSSANSLGGAAVGDGDFITGEAYTVTKSVGSGADTTGVFRPSNGLLYLKHANTTGFADVAINYGTAGDYPVAGDWDGNGTVTIGIYRNGTFYLRNSNTVGFADLVFAFGQPGDQPVAGDWNGDGTDTIGVYRNGLFLLRNSNSAGAVDTTFALGNPGDVGIAGDWNGDGMGTTGVFRPSNGVIFLKNTNTSGFADVALNYGLSGDRPVIGDWNNDGVDTIGVYRNAQFYLRNSNTNGFADLVFALGNPGDMPIAGDWDGLP